jgi:hypothetical protein
MSLIRAGISFLMLHGGCDDNKFIGNNLEELSRRLILLLLLIKTRFKYIPLLNSSHSKPALPAHISSANDRLMMPIYCVVILYSWIV